MDQTQVPSDGDNKTSSSNYDHRPSEPARHNGHGPHLEARSNPDEDDDGRGRKMERAPDHFRIDWRELTYYQRPSSLLSKCLQKTSDLFCANSKHSSTIQTGGQKRILNSLDGSFKSGQLSAILGPSGAGKSTFLSTLFGAKQDSAFGQTRVTWFTEDGQPYSQRRQLRIAQLPQHDHLLNHLTVYETLMFASKIKNSTASDKSLPDKNFHRQNVKRVAKMLKLTECLDTRCGKLSGGQYKRVSIGQELLSEPDVIILDEPTSGLDALTCYTTIKTLKSIATRHPMSIILTIHQPDIDVFNLFDQVYVIAQGGVAIYEGPPDKIAPTLATVGLQMPLATYNPARFIVENAFVVEPDAASDLTPPVMSSDEDSDEDSDSEDIREKDKSNYIRRSVVSLADAISGKEILSAIPAAKAARKDKRPLLNIGIQTLDGKLITSEKLARNDHERRQTERLNLLRRLNQIQKAPYQGERLDIASPSVSFNSSASQYSRPLSGRNSSADTDHNHELEKRLDSSAKSDYSSCGWSDDKRTDQSGASSSCGRLADGSRLTTKSSSLACVVTLGVKLASGGRSLPEVDAHSDQESLGSSGDEAEETEFVTSLNGLSSGDANSTPSATLSKASQKLRRRFDKRLSAKHSCSKSRNYPIWYHAYLLTHRTWLTIVRDPIFFGIQACMHTTIPILLALIFGSAQDEGCPRIGSFDLVDFAYSDSDNLIQATVTSIRRSIGNIGIVFFEMFVLSFSINCITALVFPMDMYVLLKEYRNGWYSLRSYFFGRTLADLPIPIVLHSIGMAILYFMTGQPHSLWRFASVIVIVILASLVAQSVGLTIGALLMRSSQSAVLAAAGIVAPFFALSGFIVRIHTLPAVAQMAAKGSYLYHLLNGFIILRYGFGRCPCQAEDFDENSAHRIPGNLHTMASMWIGTYSDEYAKSPLVLAANTDNRTNVDPNIDVVDKMMTAFKMANSYGHQIKTCDDVLPYAMLDFNVRDGDIYASVAALVLMLVVSRFITFTAIYYKIRSFA